MHSSLRIGLVSVAVGSVGIACSVSSTGGGEGPGTDPSAAPSSTSSATPPPTTTGTTSPPASDGGTDSAPPIDKTPVLTFVRDGQTQTIFPNTLKVKTNDGGGYTIDASYPAPYPKKPPLDPGASWLTISVKKKTVACASGDAYVSLLYSEPNGTITTATASNVNGTCTLDVKRLGEDGLFEGTATGVLSNSNFGRNWPFSLTWRQPTP